LRVFLIARPIAGYFLIKDLHVFCG
jgi:hypothetical protein